MTTFQTTSLWPLNNESPVTRKVYQVRIQEPNEPTTSQDFRTKATAMPILRLARNIGLGHREIVGALVKDTARTVEFENGSRITLTTIFYISPKMVIRNGGPTQCLAS